MKFSQKHANTANRCQVFVALGFCLAVNALANPTGMTVASGSASVSQNGSQLTVNPCKAKKLTNMRSVGDGKGIQLNPPLKMSLERALEYIGPDEYVEATPKNLRLRKKILNEVQRKRAAQSRTARVVAE